LLGEPCGFDEEGRESMEVFAYTSCSFAVSFELNGSC